MNVAFPRSSQRTMCSIRRINTGERDFQRPSGGGPIERSLRTRFVTVCVTLAISSGFRLGLNTPARGVPSRALSEGMNGECISMTRPNLSSRIRIPCERSCVDLSLSCNHSLVAPLDRRMVAASESVIFSLRLNIPGTRCSEVRYRFVSRRRVRSKRSFWSRRSLSLLA